MRSSPCSSLWLQESNLSAVKLVSRPDLVFCLLLADLWYRLVLFYPKSWMGHFRSYLFLPIAIRGQKRHLALLIGPPQRMTDNHLSMKVRLGYNSYQSSPTLKWNLIPKIPFSTAKRPCHYCRNPTTYLCLWLVTQRSFSYSSLCAESEFWAKSILTWLSWETLCCARFEPEAKFLPHY